MTESVTLDFAPISSEEVQRITTSRSTKYTKLVGACMDLNPGQAIKVPVPDDEEAAKMRINVSNAVRTKIAPAWKALGQDQHVRIVLGADGNGSYIAIVCHAGVPAPRKPRTAKPKVPVATGSKPAKIGKPSK